MVFKGNTISVAMKLPGQDSNADYPDEHGFSRIKGEIPDTGNFNAGGVMKTKRLLTPLIPSYQAFY